MKGRLCIVVHGSYPLGEPKVARKSRVASELGFDVEVLVLQQRRGARKETFESRRMIAPPAFAVVPRRRLLPRIGDERANAPRRCVRSVAS